MNKFAFVGHFISRGHFNDLVGWPAFVLRRLPQPLLKDLIRIWPPYRCIDISPVQSLTHSQAYGIGISCPLLPEHFVTLNSREVLKKIIDSARLGERFGARIIGLGGFTSAFGNEGEEVAQRLNVSVTSGNTYTAALTIQGLLKSAELMELNVSESRVAVIGATGDIGSICAKVFSKKCAELILAARKEKRLIEFASEIECDASARIRIAKHTTDAIKDADLILTATSAITTLIEPADLKVGAIVCDVAYPANISRDIWQRRDDVFVFEGGLATWPFYNQLKDLRKLQQFSPPGTVHGCLAETMLLALEEKFVNFSLGRGYITEARIDEIVGIAQKHGFTLAPFRCGDISYSHNDIDRIRKAAKAKRQSQVLVV